MVDELRPPTAESTVAVVLGAGEYPQHTEWTNHVLAASALAVRDYLRSPIGMAMQPGQILDLFDADDTAPDQLVQIENFLRATGTANARDLVLYYVGHGDFDDYKHYCLGIRASARYRKYTLMKSRELATAVRGAFGQKRIYVIYDACFAASALPDWQGSKIEVAAREMSRSLPEHGIAFLAAASKDDVTYAPQDERYTVFTGAVLEALTCGVEQPSPRISLHELHEEVRRRLERRSCESGERPEIFAPTQQGGDVSRLELFPNAAYQRRVKTELLRAEAEARTAEASATAESKTRRKVLAEAEAETQMATRAAASRPDIDAPGGHVSEPGRPAGKPLSDDEGRGPGRDRASISARDSTIPQVTLPAQAVPEGARGHPQKTERMAPAGQAPTRPLAPAPAPAGTRDHVAASISKRPRGWIVISGAAAVAVAAVIIIIIHFGSSRDNDAATSVGAFPHQLESLADSCEHTVPTACTALGTAYFRGDGVVSDPVRALVYFEKACSLKDPDGCMRVGVGYHLGLGKTKDDATAARLFTEACDGGASEACMELGTLYLNGEGVGRDDARAALLFDKACSATNYSACGRLGELYVQGAGVVADPERGRALLDRSCSNRAALPCKFLGDLYATGSGAVPQDSAKARKAYAAGCRLGEQTACDLLQ